MIGVSTAPSKPSPVPDTWNRLLQPYLTHLGTQGSRTSTIETRRQHLECLARSIEADPLDVTETRLAQWCAAQTWRPESRRARLTSFRLFWRWAGNEGLLDDVAMGMSQERGRSLPPMPTPDLVYLHALRRSDARSRMILRLAAEVGLGRNEIARIHRERDLLLHADGCALAVGGVGNGARYRPLPEELSSELLDSGPGWVFPGKDGGHLSPRWISALAARALGAEWTLRSLQPRFAVRACAVDRVAFAL